MPLYHIIILAIIQGLTEFLPVSSSGHLGLYHCLTDHCDHWDQENLTLDVAVHLGTLLSVLLYFWRDVVQMVLGVRDIGVGKISTSNAKLTSLVIIGSIPVILLGLVLHYWEPDALKTLHVIAWKTLIFGIVLWVADSKFPSDKDMKELTLKDAVLIGLAQMLALIPGVSRSGITMTAARTLGFSRVESARYSLLLSMVAISGAGTLIGLSLFKSGDVSLGMDALIAVILSFICGWISITAMMKFLQNQSFTVFAVYRVVLGVLLLGLIYGGVIG
ncbi:MAG: undecaprenyl-diphosphatase [Alphaproteobacteria bacterium]|nr:undecaprenyl-diphosphatase [Alphaproteobacteria bacterium]